MKRTDIVRLAPLLPLLVLCSASQNPAWINYTDECSVYSSCSKCLKEKCMWVVHPDCRERCVKQNYVDPNGKALLNKPWLGQLKTCRTMKCSVFNNAVQNPSFEEWLWDSKENTTLHPPWMLSDTQPIANNTVASEVVPGSASFDGEYFMLMGGRNRLATYTATQIITINKHATHIFLFYALPKFAGKDSSLEIWIDAKASLVMNNLNYNMYKTGNCYTSLLFSVSNFADDGKHALTIKFTGDSTESVAYVDYINLISLNCKDTHVHINNAFYLMRLLICLFTKLNHQKTPENMWRLQ